MLEEELKEAFKTNSKKQLQEIRAACKELITTLASEDDNEIKFTAMLSRLLHDALFKDLPKKAILLCSDNVYPH